MQPFHMFSWDTLVLGAFVWLLAVSIVGGIWFIWRRRCASTDPRCARCGYIVRGISTFTCPECGSDLREVGILPPGTPRPPGRLVRCAAWTLVLPVPAIVLSSALQIAIGPANHIQIIRRSVSCNIGSQSIEFEALMDGQVFSWFGGKWREPTVPMQRLVFTRPTGRTAMPALVVDRATNGYEFVDANGVLIRRADGFGPDAILEWWQALGLDTQHLQARAVAEHLLISAEERTQQEGNTIRFLPAVVAGPARSIRYTTLEWPVYALWGGVWLLVWLAGIQRIRRRPGSATVRPREGHGVPRIG